MSAVLHEVPPPSELDYGPFEGPVTADDREMFLALGHAWPGDQSREVEWLAELNGLVEASSIILSRRDSPEVAGEVHDLRGQFFGGFAELNLKAQLRDERNRPTPKSYIGHQRVLWQWGVDVGKVAQMDGARQIAGETVHRNMLEIEKLGLDPVRVANGCFGALGYSTEAVTERLQPFYAAAAVSGVEDYRTWTQDFISKHPYLLGQKPDRSRILIRIAALTFASDGIEQLEDEFDFFGYNVSGIKMNVVTYLRHGRFIDSGRRFKAFAQRYQEYGDDELLEVIADPKHRDDPVVKAYLRAYPVDDLEAVAFNAQRHRRALWRRRRDRDEMMVDWQGPALLGAPDAPAGRAFKNAIDYDPPDADDLLRREFALADAIVRGDQGEEQVMRRSLAAICLPWVVGIAEESKVRGEHAEKMALGNVALTEVVHAYQPHSHEWRRGLAESVILGIMKRLENYSPRFQGMTIREVEDRRSKALAELGEVDDDPPDIMQLLTAAEEFKAQGRRK